MSSKILELAKRVFGQDIELEWEGNWAHNMVKRGGHTVCWFSSDVQELIELTEEPYGDDWMTAEEILVVDAGYTTAQRAKYRAEVFRRENTKKSS